MDITKFDLPPGTLVRICSEAEAQRQHGWRLVALVPIEGPEQHEELTVRDGMTRREMVWRDQKNVRYVFAQDANETIEEARREARTAQAAEDAYKAKLFDMTHELAREKKLVGDLKDELAVSRSNYQASSAQLAAAHEAKSKMETDIAKLRKAFGEVRMREILGS